MIANKDNLSSVVAEIGTLVLNNKYGISADTGSGQDVILGAEVGNTEGSDGEILIGNTIIQFGRVTASDTVGTKFVVTYPKPLQNPPSFVGITPAGNNYSVAASSVQVDGETGDPTATLANFVVTGGAGTGNDFFYWMVIGRRTDIASA